jgi:SAM-dependent methyltransferase
VADTAELTAFYEQSYAQDTERADVHARWRALGAVGKADHVLELCARAGLRPESTLDVGCGDGALLCELRRRGFGGRLTGVEIAPAAVAIARDREPIDAVERYDGRRLPAGDGEYGLGVLCHVLEHVPEPAALLAEVARACRAVVVEVPLEDNLSARRAAKREHAREVGHLQRLSRAGARQTVAEAGLRLVSELEDPLPLEVHRFLAASARAGAATTSGDRDNERRATGNEHRTAAEHRATGGERYPAATAKWALRAGLHRLAPGTARRLFTMHYACLCLPAG